MFSQKLAIHACVATFLACASLAHASRTVALAWDPSNEADIAGYHVYYGSRSGSYNQAIDAGNTTATNVANLSEGNTYYVVVTAYNSASVESLPSNEVAFTVAAADPTPTPTPAPTATPQPTPTATPKPTPTPTAAAKPKVGVLARSLTVRAGSTAVFNVLSSRVNPTQPTVVNFVMGGTAISGTNYSMAQTGQVTIPAGSKSATVSLKTIAVPRSGKKIVTISILPSQDYLISVRSAYFKIINP